jgi:NADH dehydrogenase [ubiquinone] 1 alpha subcomplex assembly factor 1
MTINRQTDLLIFSLVMGLLLLTLPGPSLDAADSGPKGEPVLTDFTPDSPDFGWYVQNDNVMGGRSEGDFEQPPGELIFAGSTNTNGGGFSSIRTQPVQLDLSSHEGIRLRVKGDGRRYTWQLQTNARWRGRQVSYWADFETLAGEWSTVDIPFARFFPQFRGTKLDGPELEPGQVTEMALYIYDKQDGPFKLHLASVDAFTK